MCGITGIVCADRRPASPVDRAAHDGRARAPRAGRRGLLRARTVALRAPAPGDHRPQRRPATSRWPPPTAPTRSPTTARSTTSRSCERSSRRSGIASARAPTPRSCCDAYAEWGLDARRALQRDVRVRGLGPRSRARLVLARDRYGIKPLYYAYARRHAAVRLGDQGVAATPGRAEPSSTRTHCSSTSPSRTSSPTARCSRASSCCPPAAR